MTPDEVSDFQSFLRFVNWLASDRAEEVAKERVSPSNTYGPGYNGWENGTIEAFLDAAAAWAMDWYSAHPPPPEASWREFAKILQAGKFYE